MPMPQLLIDFYKDFKLINIKALPMAASFTFSIELLAAGVMTTHLNDDESYAAASILFQAYTYTIMQLSFSPVPYVGIRLSPFFGELHALESDNASAEESIRSAHMLMNTSSWFFSVRASVILYLPSLRPAIVTAMLFEESIPFG